MTNTMNISKNGLGDDNAMSQNTNMSHMNGSPRRNGGASLTNNTQYTNTTNNDDTGSGGREWRLTQENISRKIMWNQNIMKGAL